MPPACLPATAPNQAPSPSRVPHHRSSESHHESISIRGSRRAAVPGHCDCSLQCHWSKCSRITPYHSSLEFTAFGRKLWLMEVSYEFTRFANSDAVYMDFERCDHRLCNGPSNYHAVRYVARQRDTVSRSEHRYCDI